ncbi:MAG: anti-sigma factor [Chloroflexota bacterium]|nr:anti-sigma factor [Chloroflexota bacterium]
MDHAEARELLELAAVEPGGLDRLMAGDIPDAAALAGHLAGCRDCTVVLTRLRRDAAVIASVVRSTPPPALRDRTLEYVRQVGRDRSAPSDVAAIPRTGSGSLQAGGSWTRGRRIAVLAGLAAVLIAAVAGTGVILGARDAVIAQQADVVTALSKVTSSTLRLEAQPDVRRVELAGGPGSTASGSILFSPASHELVVVASGLIEPTAGRELRCWVEVAGQRNPVGRMYFGGDLSYWVGQVELLGDVGAGARFGVSLVDASGTSVGGDPVLTGELQ